MRNKLRLPFFGKHKVKSASELADLAKESIRQEQKYLIWSNNSFFLREAYKATRTNVMFSLAGNEGCQVVAVTSALQSEGKSITICNLAMSLVDMGKSVLIMDCDLRRPKINRLLNISAKAGLTDVLVDKNNLSNALIRLKESKDLWVMTSGRIPPNPSELLASQGMKNLLEQMRVQYDFILVDTPPVEVVTDAMVLSPLVDGFLFVVKANQSNRNAVTHAVDQLEYANAKILGLVFNGTSQGGGGYGYKKYGYKKYGYRGYSRYGYYGRGYGYGYGYGGGYGYGYYGYGYQSPPDQPDAPPDAPQGAEMK